MNGIGLKGEKEIFILRGQLILTKVVQTVQWRKEQTGLWQVDTHMKNKNKNKAGHLFHTMHKDKLKFIKDLNVRAKNYETLYYSLLTIKPRVSGML